jgi:hypothetical protein
MRHDLWDWHVDEQWLVSVCLLAESCVLVGETVPVGSLYDLLLRYGAQNAVAVPELALDSASRPLGILATELGRYEDAERHFRRAAGMNELMGARPWLAHTRLEHARMLLRRDGDGDRERAAELLAAAQAAYRELGMRVAQASAGSNRERLT